MGIPYSGNSIVDASFVFHELDIALSDAPSGESRRHRFEKKRDKYMNWCIAITETACDLQIEYREHHDMETGTNILLPLPKVEISVREKDKDDEQNTGITTGNEKDPRPAFMLISNGFMITITTVISQCFSDSQELLNVVRRRDQYDVPVRHRHCVDVVVKETQIVMEQLTIDAVIRIVSEIRYYL